MVLRAWLRRMKEALVEDDLNPQASALDRMDGRGTPQRPPGSGVGSLGPTRGPEPGGRLTTDTQARSQRGSSGGRPAETPDIKPGAT